MYSYNQELRTMRSKEQKTEQDLRGETAKKISVLIKFCCLLVTKKLCSGSKFLNLEPEHNFLVTNRQQSLMRTLIF